MIPLCTANLASIASCKVLAQTTRQALFCPWLWIAIVFLYSVLGTAHTSSQSLELSSLSAASPCTAHEYLQRLVAFCIQSPQLP